LKWYGRVQYIGTKRLFKQLFMWIPPERKMKAYQERVSSGNSGNNGRKKPAGW
jgi:hypothetical protein